MTLSLAAVFIPIVFMGGIVGRLLHEFAVTIILAILISGVVSVTLTPMLCARILKDEHGQKHNWFYRWSESGFQRACRPPMTAACAGASRHRPVDSGRVRRQHRWPASVLFAIMQQDFLPSDDTGQLARQRPDRRRHLVRPDDGLYRAGHEDRRAPIPMSQAMSQMDGEGAPA